MNSKSSIENLIKSKALELGFSAAGISSVHLLTDEKIKLQRWLDINYNGSMTYLERNIDKRENPALLVENAKSIISVLLNYFPDKLPADNQHYKISKYALGIDYHYVIKDKLNQLIGYLKDTLKIEANFRCFSDSAPIFDKTWASTAGLGWIGKNSLLINKNLGSFFFIGEIITDLKLQPDEPFIANHCGNCSACIDACPTSAIIAPFTIDARKCISYQTIENKEEIPLEIIEIQGDLIFGCDICQDVCPWNRKSKPHNISEFKLSDILAKIDKESLENITSSDFRKQFKSSPLARAGHKKLKQTIAQIKAIVKIS